MIHQEIDQMQNVACQILSNNNGNFKDCGKRTLRHTNLETSAFAQTMHGIRTELKLKIDSEYVNFSMSTDTKYNVFFAAFVSHNNTIS